MRYPESAEEDIARFADHRHDEGPPQQVMRALYSITAGRAILHGHGQMRYTKGSSGTEWSLIAITESTFVTVEASAPETLWTWQHSTVHTGEVSMLGRAEPLDQLQSVQATRTRLVGRAHGPEEWVADYAVTIAGRRVELPRSTESRRAAEREVLEGIAVDLLRRL